MSPSAATVTPTRSCRTSTFNSASALFSHDHKTPHPSLSIPGPEACATAPAPLPLQLSHGLSTEHLASSAASSVPGSDGGADGGGDDDASLVRSFYVHQVRLFFVIFVSVFFCARADGFPAGFVMEFRGGSRFYVCMSVATSAHREA